MARIPKDVVERLRQDVSVVRLIEARGIELRKHGSSELVGRCPFHDDRTPSLVVNPKKNLWHCLGACQMGGSVIDWVMKAEGVSFRHAAELLMNQAGLEGELPKGRSGRKVAKQTTTPKLSAPVDESADDAKLLGQVTSYYHETLKKSPEALDYLAKRGLSHSSLVAEFELGFSNRTLGYRLPKKNRKAGAEIRERLLSLGVLRKSGHEHLNGSIVVPLFDEAGQVVNLYGRKITSGLRKGTALHLYLPGPHRGLLNRKAIRSSRDLILCESALDAMTFWCAGYRNVTTSYGVGGFTDELFAAMKKHGTKRVLIAYDRDEAGDKAALALAPKLADAGMTSYRVLFPKGMDANAYAQAMAPADKALGVCIRSAKWMAGTKSSSVPKAVVSEVAEVAEEVTHPSPAELETASSARTTPPAAKNEELSPLAANELGPATPAVDEAPRAQPGGTEPTSPDVPARISGDEVTLTLGPRTMRVRGLSKNRAHDQLKVNLLYKQEEAFFVDQVDLYSARQRSAFVEQAAAELSLRPEVVKSDLGKVILKLEELQDERLAEATKPEKTEDPMTAEERAEALELLRDKKLLSRILEDFGRAGLIGEEENKLIAYLAALSRKLDEPLAVLVQSTSAAGKSALMDAVLSFVPDQERVQYSAMTGQSLYYLGETDLSHKILAIAEEEGAERASYALKLLQSEGELTIASTGKDPQSGRLVTQEYRVEGPVMIFLTTTAIDIDEELLNRCLVLTVDETAEQTQAIHDIQRKRRTLAGLLAKSEKDSIVRLHQNAQRLLEPLAVVNPFAEELSFASAKTRTRRDHPKYLTLIDAIALLHQHQREKKTVQHRGKTLTYIEVTKSDIAVANRLAKRVLGRSMDELPPQTRRLLTLIGEMVAEASAMESVAPKDFYFSRRQLRDFAGWGQTQLKVHLSRLVEMEYLAVHRTGHKQAYLYELLVTATRSPQGESDAGVEDIHQLTLMYDANRSGQNALRSGAEGHWSGCGRGAVGLRSGLEESAQVLAAKSESTELGALRSAETETTHVEKKKGRRIVPTNGHRNGVSVPASR